MSADESKEKLSKTPSWIMVGFVLGVLAVLGFQHELQRPDAPAEVASAIVVPAPAPKPAESVTALPDLPSLAVIEAVFSDWGGYARWEHDRTEVALWNSTTGDFTDYFEVARAPEGLYFRSITRLTRPLTEAKPPSEAPLRFTEPAIDQEARRAGRLNPRSEPVEAGPWRDAPSSSVPARPAYLPPPAPPAGEPKV